MPITGLTPSRRRRSNRRPKHVFYSSTAYTKPRPAGEEGCSVAVAEGIAMHIKMTGSRREVAAAKALRGQTRLRPSLVTQQLRRRGSSCG